MQFQMSKFKCQIKTSNESPELLNLEAVEDLGRLNHNVILDLFQNPVLNFHILLVFGI